MPSAFIFSVLGAFIGFVALSTVIWFTHDPKEPPIVLNSIPFFSPIIEILTKQWKFFLSLRNETRLSICTLRLPFTRLYLIMDTALINSVDRQIKTISFSPIEANATAGFLGTTEITNKIMRHNPTADDGHFKTFHKAIRPTLAPGSGLDGMLQSTFRAMESYLGQQSHIGSVEFDLFRWVQHQIILATTSGEYGRKNPFLDPEVEQAWYDFIPSIHYFALGLFPKLLAKKSYAAREFLSKTFENYFEHQHHLDGASASVFARTNHGITTGLPASDRARGEIGFSMSLVNNTVPSTFWLIYHIFSDPAILEECRQELHMAVRVDDKGTRIIDLADLKAHCTVLISTLNEIYRYYGVATTLVRQVTEDHMLDGTYLLTKGSYVAMPTSVQHYSREIWGSDVEKFKHKRFVHERATGKISSDPSKRHDPAGFRVFGGGALLCPGRHFANNAILSFAAMVILRFDIRAVSDGNNRGGWDSVNAENSFGLNIARMLLHPEKDLRVRMTPLTESIKGGGSLWQIQLAGSADIPVAFSDTTVLQTK
ncbi:cytochrome P450 oxidoreductase [Nemania sp. FL0916]|nr:cytochrome P450 oxidoreductase [Nemania sp. FL0916]